MATPKVDGYQRITEKAGPKATLGIEWDGVGDSGYDALTLPLSRLGAIDLREMIDDHLQDEQWAGTDDPLPGTIEPGAVLIDHEYDDAVYVVANVCVDEAGQTQVRLAEGDEETLVAIGDIIERFAADELSFGSRR